VITAKINVIDIIVIDFVVRSVLYDINELNFDIKELNFDVRNCICTSVRAFCP
jgi:hypothetical protein